MGLYFYTIHIGYARNAIAFFGFNVEFMKFSQEQVSSDIIKERMLNAQLELYVISELNGWKGSSVVSAEKINYSQLAD